MFLRICLAWELRGEVRFVGTNVEMSGGRKQVKLAGGRPRYGEVRRLSQVG